MKIPQNTQPCGRDNSLYLASWVFVFCLDLLCQPTNGVFQSIYLIKSSANSGFWYGNTVLPPTNRKTTDRSVSFDKKHRALKGKKT
jgi:hypothetical protein